LGRAGRLRQRRRLRSWRDVPLRSLPDDAVEVEGDLIGARVHLRDDEAEATQHAVVLDLAQLDLVGGELSADLERALDLEAVLVVGAGAPDAADHEGDADLLAGGGVERDAPCAARDGVAG